MATTYIWAVFANWVIFTIILLSCQNAIRKSDAKLLPECHVFWSDKIIHTFLGFELNQMLQQSLDLLFFVVCCLLLPKQKVYCAYIKTKQWDNPIDCSYVKVAQLLDSGVYSHWLMQKKSCTHYRFLKLIASRSHLNLLPHLQRNSRYSWLVPQHSGFWKRAIWSYLMKACFHKWD